MKMKIVGGELTINDFKTANVFENDKVEMIFHPAFDHERDSEVLVIQVFDKENNRIAEMQIDVDRKELIKAVDKNKVIFEK